MAQRNEFYYSETREEYRKRVVINGKMRDVWGKTKTIVREKIKQLEAEALLEHESKKGVRLSDYAI